MAIQVLNDPSRDASAQSIGGGISSALQGLVSHKLGQIQQQKQHHSTMQGLQALGYTPQQSAQLAHLDPQSLQQIVKQKLAEPGERAYASALGSLLGEQPQQQPNLAPVEQMQSSPSNGLSDKQKAQLKRHLESPRGKIPYSPEYIKKLQSHLEQPQQIEQQTSSVQQGNGSPLKGLNAKQATDIAKLGFEKKKSEFQEKKFEHELRKEALAETKEIRKELFAKKKAAQDTIESVQRFEELEKEGLPGAGYVEFLKETGLDIPALVGAPAEEYNKVAANFVRNAKAMFGSRLTDTDLNQFLKTVPSLSNSPEGRKRIDANLKRIANLDVAAVDAYNDIIKENKGIPPLDLDVQLDKKLDKKRDAIYRQFKKDLLKEVPEGESSLATALLSGAGKLVGRIPKAALGAGVGAAAGGRYAGVPGAIGGGILGGLGGLAGVSIKDLI